MDKYYYRRERENSNPSFSSSLLDEIYRTIDEREHLQVGEGLVLYRESIVSKKQSSNFNSAADVDFRGGEFDMASFQKASCLSEKLLEEKVSEKVVVRRKSAGDFGRKPRNDRDALFFNSSSSSGSDSRCGGGFSSSEAESVYGISSRSSSCYGLQKPKSIRTSFTAQHENFNKHGHFERHERRETTSQAKPGAKPRQESGFVKKKSRALKIYGDLKKVKQPTSPGGRLASFLNSLFTAANAKKAKISSSGVIYDHDNISPERKLKSANASTCSSASSRSCLSKTPSSAGKLSSNGTKRSVRFYPVSVIVDEDCQPCGKKSLYDDKPFISIEADKNLRNSITEELKFHAMEKNRRVEEAARDLLRNFQKRVEACEFEMRDAQAHIQSQVFNHVDDDDDDKDEDDAASYASSDLFELGDLSAIGMDQRYREELPVYETTHIDTNRAIADDLIL